MVNFDTSTAKARQAIKSISCLHLVSISPHPSKQKNIYKTYRHGILRQLHRSKSKFFSSILCRAKWNYSKQNHARCKGTGLGETPYLYRKPCVFWKRFTNLWVKCFFHSAQIKILWIRIDRSTFIWAKKAASCYANCGRQCALFHRVNMADDFAKRRGSWPWTWLSDIFAAIYYSRLRNVNARSTSH